MKLALDFGNEVVVLPRAALAHLDKATKKDIRILLALCQSPLALADLPTHAEKLAAELGTDKAEIDSAVAFWRGAGVLVCKDEDGEAAKERTPAAPTPTPLPKKPSAERGMPSYSTEELSGILERRGELAVLIDACQQTFGKIFNTAEVGIVAGMIDYLGVDGDYVLLLLSHCVRMEKRSLRYAEKMALSLYDEGIDRADALAERLHRIELMADATGQIRAMFGLSSRALTTKEKAMVEKWICTMQYGMDILQKAYEITVDSIGKASIPYANTILERWHAEGYRSIEDIDRAIAEYRRQKNENSSSFDTDDFFEAALKRTYGAN